MYYRRANTQGGCYFFTLNLQNRQSSLFTQNIQTLRQSLHKVKQNHPFHLDAAVILPDHMHLLMTLPAEDSNFSKRIMLLKTSFSRKIPKTEQITNSRGAKGERGIWQRRYWEHLIRNEEDYINHVNYIHYNPVKHGYVHNPADWKYSSIHRFIKKGILPPDWGASEPIISGQFGEFE